MSRIGEMKSIGYELKAARVDFIVHRTKEDTGKEVGVILPELNFERILPVQLAPFSKSTQTARAVLC